MQGDWMAENATRGGGGQRKAIGVVDDSKRGP
jgi:hypothetical protein